MPSGLWLLWGSKQTFTALKQDRFAKSVENSAVWLGVINNNVSFGVSHLQITIQIKNCRCVFSVNVSNPQRLHGSVCVWNPQQEFRHLSTSHWNPSAVPWCLRETSTEEALNPWLDYAKVRFFILQKTHLRVFLFLNNAVRVLTSPRLSALSTVAIALKRVKWYVLFKDFIASAGN